MAVTYGDQVTKKIACFIIQSVQQKEPIQFIIFVKKILTRKAKTNKLNLCCVIAMKICCIAETIFYEKKWERFIGFFKNCKKYVFGG